MRKLTFLIILLPFFVQAQIVQPQRFETELKTYDDGYEVMTGGENGVIVYRSVNEYDKKGGQLWEFIMLDTTLNVTWKKQLFIEKDLAYKGYDYSLGSFYFLFQTYTSNSKDLKLLQMRASTGDTLPRVRQVTETDPASG